MAVEYVPKEQARMEFLALTGEERKKRGKKKAAKSHERTLYAARLSARYLARHGEIITIEDIYRKTGIDPKYLGNAAGSVFMGNEWEWCGFRKAERPGQGLAMRLAPLA